MSDRRFIVPEVVQTSLMDCGPASLKAVLEGFGIPLNYERLREQCQTNVDGTSLDALTALGAQAGLDATEILAPRDSVLLPEADLLPAIVVTRSAGGQFHFVVAWNAIGPFVQIMDPQTGRRLERREAFLASLAEVRVAMTASAWRRWAASDDALRPLRAKMRRLGASERQMDAWIGAADVDAGWCGHATLDAAVRMATTLVHGRALRRGAAACRLVSAASDRTGRERAEVPPGFFWVREGAQPGMLSLRGVPLVHFERPRRRAGDGAAGAARRAPRSGPYRDETDASDDGVMHRRCGTVVPEDAQRALRSPNVHVLSVLWSLVRVDARASLVALACATAVGALVASCDALLLRSVLDAARYLELTYQRVVGIALLVVFAIAGLFLERFAGATVHRIGAALELRLRVGLLEKLPRLHDAYLRSRPTSDMAARAHALHVMREAPVLGVRLARSVLAMGLTTAAVVWLSPRSAPLAIAAAGLSLLVPYLLRKPLVESALRMRTHSGALQRFYLDSLIGTAAIRAHGAERAVRREHESLLVEWARAAHGMHGHATLVSAVQALTGTALAAAIVAAYLEAGGGMGAMLLLVFLALRLPTSGQEIVQALTTYPQLRNVAMRLLSPLGADEITTARAPTSLPEGGSDGVHVEFRHVTVRATGHTILRDVCLDIPAGSHVAVVGASGAGKSSLVGTLLGWLTPSEGVVCVDGVTLDGDSLSALRRRTAWVDPAVHLWNHSLLDNLLFGAGRDGIGRLPEAIERADLADVLEGLPEGLSTELGEGGARVSGGQGQRVRIGRALVRADARLVLLDEPFRGLERAQRRALLARMRGHFRGATIVFVSHDVGDTLGFDRVLVVDGGRIIEDGAPRTLVSNVGSRYRALALADRRMRDELRSRSGWRRLEMRRGALREAERAS